MVRVYPQGSMRDQTEIHIGVRNIRVYCCLLLNFSTFAEMFTLNQTYEITNIQTSCNPQCQIKAIYGFTRHFINWECTVEPFQSCRTVERSFRLRVNVKTIFFRAILLTAQSWFDWQRHFSFNFSSVKALHPSPLRLIRDKYSVSWKPCQDNGEELIVKRYRSIAWLLSIPLNVVNWQLCILKCRRINEIILASHFHNKC